MQIINHPPLFFNQTGVSQTSLLNCNQHLKAIFQKTNKIIVLLRKVQTLLPRAPLITNDKFFIRPHLDYGDMIYDQTLNMSFEQKMETIQYNATLAKTASIRGSSREKLYQKLGLETLQQRCWYRKLCCCFYSVLKLQSPKYFYSIIPIHNMLCRTRQCNKTPAINVKHEFFKNSFFTSTKIEWNKLDWEIKNSESIESFNKIFLSFIRPSLNSTFNSPNPKGIKFL